MSFPNQNQAQVLASPNNIAQNPLIQQTMQGNPALQQHVQNSQQNYNLQGQVISQQAQPQGQPPPQQQAPGYTPPNQQQQQQTQQAIPDQFLPSLGQAQTGVNGFVPANQAPIPAQGYVPPQQQQGQGMPQQMGVDPAQQQQQQAPVNPEEWEVDTSSFEGVAEDVLQDAIDRAYEAGMTPDQAQQALAEEAQAGRFMFDDLEVKEEYDANLGQLEQALAEEYGQDGAVEAFKTLYQNLHAQGGDALLQKFMTDPEMLSPEIVSGYLEGGEGAENPYTAHIRQSAPRMAPGAGPEHQQQQSGFPGQMSLDQITQEEAQIYSRIHQGNPADGQRLVQLGMAKRQMAAQNQGGMLTPGGF